jgi:hypothetical protein
VATLDDLNAWLVQIAENTRRARDAAERRGAADDRSGGPPWVESLGRRLEGVLRTATAAGVGGAGALAARGFRGTVEAARMDYALEQLGRQFAAVMKPIMDGFAYAAAQVELRFRSLNGAQQNAVMGGIVGAGVGLRMGGLPGAMLGYAAGAAFMGGGGGAGQALGAAGGAWLGFRAGGIPGALLGAAGGAVAGGGDYDLLRRRGASRGMAALGAAGLGSVDLVSFLGSPFGLTNEADRVRSDLRGGFLERHGRPGPPRRDVTPFSSESMAAGGTAELIQRALIRTTAGAGFEEAGPLKPIIDLGIRVIEILLAIATGSPVPRSAVDAR